MLSKTTGVVASKGFIRRRFGSTASVLLTMALITVPAGIAAAQADEGFSMTIPLDTVVYIPWDASQLLATEPVPEQFAGHSCGVIGISHNQESVHPDNDLIVASGSSEVVIENVEDEPGGIVEAAGTLVLGSDVTVTLHMGPDAVFSAGLDVVIDCAQVTPTTIETTTTTTLAATTTSEVAPTSITPPPEETTSTVGDEALGTEVTTSTVADLEVLPFTGLTSGLLVILAIASLALGGVLVSAARRETEDS